MFAARSFSGQPATLGAPLKKTSTFLLGIYAALCFLFALFLTWQIFTAQNQPASNSAPVSSVAQAYISQSAPQATPLSRKLVRQQETLIRSRAVLNRVIDRPELRQSLRDLQTVSAPSRADLRTYILDRLNLASSINPAQITFNLRIKDAALATQVSNAIAQSYADVLALGAPVKIDRLIHAQTATTQTGTQTSLGWVIATLAISLGLGVVLLVTFLFRLQSGASTLAHYKAGGGFQPPLREREKMSPRREREKMPEQETYAPHRPRSHRPKPGRPRPGLPKLGRPKLSLPKIRPPQPRPQAAPAYQPTHRPDFRPPAAAEPARTEAPDLASPPQSQIGQFRPIGATISDRITLINRPTDDQRLALFVASTLNQPQTNLIDHLLETAWELQQRGKTTLVIDATWQPDADSAQGMGLSDLITGDADFGDILHCDETSGISYVPRGTGPMKAHTLPALIDLRDAMLSLFDVVLVNIGDARAMSLLSTFATPDAQIMIIGAPADQQSWPDDEHQMERDSWHEAGFTTVHLVTTPPAAAVPQHYSATGHHHG